MARRISGKLSHGALAKRASPELGLIRSGRAEAAIQDLKAKLSSDQADHGSWALLAYAESVLFRFEDALTAIEKARALKGDSAAYLFRHAQILSNLKKFDLSLELYRELQETRPDDLRVLDGLKIGLYYTDHKDEAIAYGARILKLKDETACADATQRDDLPALEPLAQGEKNSANVIAFSLWGEQPRYLVGAMVNARLARYLLPGWRCRYYAATDVPEAVVNDLRGTGAEVRIGKDEKVEIPRYLWRFLVADDPKVDRYLCRDCDSRLNAKEVAAVLEWQESGKPFHIMRDHILHSEPMLAGMWGGRVASGLGMKARIRNYLDRHLDHAYGIDQEFLRTEVWPVIKSKSLTHDSYYKLAETRPFPIGGKGDEQAHVGQGIIGKRKLREEAELFKLPGRTS